MTDAEPSPPDLPPVRHHAMPDGRRIAYRHHPGDGATAAPLIVFLPGYMSDMSGGKASAVMQWAQDCGHACLLLDYSGCGISDGDFADGSLSQWRDEVLALIEEVGARTVLPIGSSMGGWLMLMVAEALGQRLHSAIGIAAAPDFTDWGDDAARKAQLEAGETVLEDNPYGPEPTPTHPVFWADGQAHRMLDRTVAIDAPVRLLQGMRDDDVPWQTSLALSEALRSDAVQLHLIKDGDHRLSRDQDIAELLRLINELIPS